MALAKFGDNHQLNHQKTGSTQTRIIMNIQHNFSLFTSWQATCLNNCLSDFVQNKSFPLEIACATNGDVCKHSCPLLTLTSAPLSTHCFSPTLRYPGSWFLWLSTKWKTPSRRWFLKGSDLFLVVYWPAIYHTVWLLVCTHPLIVHTLILGIGVRWKNSSCVIYPHRCGRCFIQGVPKHCIHFVFCKFSAP